MADLTTTDAVKAYAGVTSSANDTDIAALISAVSAMLHGIVGHDYEAGPFTEKYSAPFSGVIILARPTADVTKVDLYGDTLDASEYLLRGDRELYRLAGDIPTFWEPGTLNVEVTSQGVAVVPADLELAARECSAYLVKQAGWEVGSNRLGLSAQANANTGSADYFAQRLDQLPAYAKIIRQQRRLF